MMRVAIVTDSASDLSVGDFPDLNVEVVAIDAVVQPDNPTRASLDASPVGQGSLATVVPVNLELLSMAFVETYERLASEVDAILSLHSSARLSGAVGAARAARDQLRGLVPIEVVDSGAASIANGFVVRRVARAAGMGADLAELDFLARRASRNVHSMFFAESIDYLSRSARWMRDRAWPISGNGTRPLLHVEDGGLRPIERVRTRARGYDRLAEFVELFPHVDALAILHDAPASDLELLLRRMDPLFPRDQILVGHYGSVLRAQLGPRAIGVFVDQGIEPD